MGYKYRLEEKRGKTTILSVSQSHDALCSKAYHVEFRFAEMVGSRQDVSALLTQARVTQAYRQDRSHTAGRFW